MIAFNLFRPETPYEEIDILIQSPVPYDQAKRHEKKIKVGSLVIHVVSIDHLIQMKKKAGREQDASDIQSLQKVKNLHK